MTLQHCLCGLRMSQFFVLDGLPETLNFSVSGLFSGLEAIDTRDEVRPFTDFSLKHFVNILVLFFQVLNVIILFLGVHLVEEAVVAINELRQSASNLVDVGSTSSYI